MSSYLSGLLACGILCGATAQASDEFPWDFDLTIGGNIPDNPKLLNREGEMDIDPGLTMSFGLTYHATPWLRIGPEFVMNMNTVDDIGDLDPHQTTTLFQMPMMLNAIFEPTLDSPFRPFIGAGAGGSLSVLNSSIYYRDYWYYYEYDAGSDTDFVFAWQAFAGLRWQMNERFALGLQYRYVWTDQQEWDFTRIGRWYDEEFPIATDSYGTHCITLLFSASF
jgi:opacity protein-like surface antigen